MTLIIIFVEILFSIKEV